MEKAEQRFVVKFFFVKDFDSKIIHKKLTAILGSTVYALTQITEWRAHLKAGELLCEDKCRSRRPPHVLRKALSDFLEEFPFATAGIIA
jgi:hypothetical protein